jgi:taurine dioxygenase
MREIDTTGKTENLGEAEINKASKCAIHPIVTRHPITGKRNVYANPSHTAKINNFSFQESEELLKEIFQHTNQGNFLYRHEYQDYDVILWDNRGKSRTAVTHLVISASASLK